MIDFAADLAAIMADGLAVDATYTPGGGSSVAVRVIRNSPDEVANFGAARIISATTTLLVAVGQVPTPRPGDTFVISGETLIVQGEPERDSRRLRWSINTVPG